MHPWKSTAKPHPPRDDFFFHMELLAFTLLSSIVSGFVIGEQIKDRNEGTKYATLVEWLERNDGGLYGARIQSFPGMGTGVITIQTVKVSCLCVYNDRGHCRSLCT